MNFNINLATRVYINFKRVNFFLTVSLLFCICWLAVNLYTINSNLEQKNRYSEFINKQSKGLEGKAVSEADYNKFLVKVKNVNSILYKRSYDWLSLLENLEQLVPSGVSLSSLQPSAKGKTLTLAGTATGFSAIRQFVENLEGSKAFTEIYLTNQAVASIDNKRKAINFTVTCTVANS